MKNNLARSGSNGVSAYCFGEIVTANDFIEAEALLSMNYGVDYPRQKFMMLWNMLKEDNWTAERLKATVKWFLKHKKFATWVIADWYEYDVKIYPYSWYLEQIKNGVRNEEIEMYEYNGVTVFKLKDGTELPPAYQKKALNKEKEENQTNTEYFKGQSEEEFAIMMRHLNNGTLNNYLEENNL